MDGSDAEKHQPESPPPDSADSEQENPGPSWILMLFLIFLAMLIATGIAWAFIHPMLHPH